MAISIPPWLQAADPAEQYTRGVQIGAQIAESKNRLAQQAQEMSMRAEVDAQERQKQHDLEQQRIKFEQAYQQQQIALRKQQLDQVAQVNAAKTENAARQYAAQKQLQDRLQAIDADTSLTESQRDSARIRAIFDYGATTHLPGTEMTAMINASRPAKPTVPASIDRTSDPENIIITQPNGTITVHPKGTPKDPNVKVLLDESNPHTFTTLPRSQASAALHAAPPGSFSDTNEVNSAAFPANVSPSPFRAPPTPSRAPVSYQPDASGRVKVKDKDGNVGTIPQENLDKALQRGYTVVQDASGQ